MDLEIMGLRIKKSRKENQLTQEQFAELIDVSPHYVYEIERGMKAMSLQTLEKVALHLNVSIDYLFWGEKDTSKNDINEDQLSKLTCDMSIEQKNRIASLLFAMMPYLKL